ncbi:MAG: hypothetical protein GC181_04610 [Bacteroidetes bacterium]|nr:hypothetical protein [Bacteroidota bacterium]
MSVFRTLPFLFFSFLVLNAFQSRGQQPVDMEKVFLVTDRYLYNPSENMYFCAYVTNDQNALITEVVQLKAELLDARNQIVDSVRIFCNNGRGGGRLTLPKTGGVYTLRGYTSWQLNPVKRDFFEKKIYVQSFVSRSFFINAEFEKENYSPGEEVTGKATFRKTDNKPIPGLAVSVRLKSNGNVINQIELKTDSKGMVHPVFAINPEETSTCYFEYSATFQGNTETQTARIPIKSPDIRAKIFNKSGSEFLLAGVENELVLQTLDVNDRPINVEGFVSSGDGKNVPVNFKTIYKGMSKVQVTPEAGKTYKVFYRCAPGDDYQTLDLPAATEKGFIITKSERNGKVAFGIKGDNRKKNIVISDVNGVLKKLMSVTPAETIEIPSDQLIEGIVSVWVSDVNGKTLAHRLFMIVRKSLKVAVKTDSMIDVNRYTNYSLNWDTDQSKSLNFTTHVVENQFLNQIKDRSHNMVSWMYLGVEFSSEIEEPQYYFDPENEHASDALDLVLTTERTHWRRNPETGKPDQRKDVFYYRGVANFYGHVYDYQNYQLPVKGASVNIKNTSAEVETDSNGMYRFSMIPASWVENGFTLIIKKGLEKVEEKINANPMFISNDFIAGSPLSLVDNEEAPVNENSANRSTRISLISPVYKYDYAIDRTENSASYTSPAIESLSRSISSYQVTSLSSVQRIGYWYYWGGIANDVSYPADVSFYNSYTRPFYVYAYPTRTGQPLMFNNALQLNSNTLYWAPIQSISNPGIAGQFRTSNKNTGYTVFCEGISENGIPFNASTSFETGNVISISFKAPTSVTFGDEIKLESIINNKADTAIRVTLYWGIDKMRHQKEVKVLPGEPYKLQFNYTATDTNRTIGAYVSANSIPQNSFSNSVVNRSIQIIPRGHKVVKTISGKGNHKIDFELQTVVSEKMYLKLNLMNDFRDIAYNTAKKMIREPHGCFEQVSSSNYPNILALKILLENPNDNANEINQLRQVLAHGYDKLAAYETSEGGFEWYGRTPPHETLTAYGLYQFYLMKQVGIPVDESLVRRSVKWLSGRRDKNGGYMFHSGKYGFSSATYEVNNAYITYVLSLIGEPIDKDQLRAIERDVDQNFDAYKLSLLGNIYYNIGETEKANTVFNKLIASYEKQNFQSVTAGISVMYSYGNSLKQECFALTYILGYRLKNYHNYSSSLSRLMTEMMKNSNYSGFGTTQSTALTMEALSYHLTNYRSGTGIPEVKMLINGVVQTTIDFRNRSEYISIMSSDLFKKGKNTLELINSDPERFIDFELHWYEENDKTEHPELALKVNYSDTSLQLGESTTATIEIENKTDKGKPQIVAVLHFAGGLNYSLEELKYLTDEKIIDYYESSENELVLYMLEMGPNEKKTIQLALTPQVCGTYHTEENYVYQYYTPEIKSSVSPVVVSIRNSNN